MPNIDISSLKKARDQLSESLRYCRSDLAKADDIILGFEGHASSD